MIDPFDSDDALSRRTGLTLENGTRTRYRYDGANRLTELPHTLRSGPLHLAYTHDALGNRLTQERTDPAQPATLTQYGYDPLSQLTSATDANQTHAYQYDALGNQQLARGQPYTPNVLNQYTSVGAHALSYDPNGNLLSDGPGTYVYDSENRLIQATRARTRATFTYDPFGRRLSRTTNGSTTYFLPDGDQRLAELDATGTPTTTYVSGPGIDEVVRMRRGSAVSYFHADALEFR